MPLSRVLTQGMDERMKTQAARDRACVERMRERASAREQGQAQ